MTNLEALSAASNHPFDDIKIRKILLDNGLNESGSYFGLTKDFELATAALYVLIVTSPNISEGDFSVSPSEKTALIGLASGIFSKYGVEDPLTSKSVIRNRSNYW